MITLLLLWTILQGKTTGECMWRPRESFVAGWKVDIAFQSIVLLHTLEPGPQIHENSVQCRHVVHPLVRDCFLQDILECFIQHSIKLFTWWASNSSSGRLLWTSRPHRKFYYCKACFFLGSCSFTCFQLCSLGPL